MKDTGERMIPESHNGQLLYGEHIIRYSAAKLIVSNKTVLDIACGTGYGSKILSQTAEKVYGVDVSQEAIKYSKKHYSDKNIKFVLGDASKIPLEDNLVDVVVSFETIEHIPNYIEFISEIKRVLKPGGTFLVSTPNDDEYPEDNEFHVHEFTLKEFKNLMKKEFTYQKYYYQSSWFYTGIFDEDKFTKEWQGEIDTHKVSKIKKNKAPYFIAICSDDKITSKVVNIGAITQPWSDRDNIEYQKSIKNQIKTLEDKNKILENSIMEIKNSRTFKAADKIRKIIKPNRVK